MSPPSPEWVIPFFHLVHLALLMLIPFLGKRGGQATLRTEKNKKKLQKEYWEIFLGWWRQFLFLITKVGILPGLWMTKPKFQFFPFPTNYLTRNKSLATLTPLHHYNIANMILPLLWLCASCYWLPYISNILEFIFIGSFHSLYLVATIVFYLQFCRTIPIDSPHSKSCV